MGAIKDNDSSKCHMPNIDLFFHMRLHAASWKKKVAGKKKNVWLDFGIHHLEWQEDKNLFLNSFFLSS